MGIFDFDGSILLSLKNSRHIFANLFLAIYYRFL